MTPKGTSEVSFSFESKDEKIFWKSIVQEQLRDCLKTLNEKSAQGCAHLAAEIADAAVIEYRRRVK